MNISSKRFAIKSDGFGGVNVRDRNAPYHCHHIKAHYLPTVDAMAQMKERDFNRAIIKAINPE